MEANVQNRWPYDTPPGPPTLHHLSSSKSMGILMALEELIEQDPSFTYTIKVYRRLKGAGMNTDIQKFHPLGKSPSIAIDPPKDSGDTKPISVIESRLILQFIEKQYSKGIWEPINPQSAADTEFWLEFAGATFLQKCDFTMLFELIPDAMPFFLKPIFWATYSFFAKLQRQQVYLVLDYMEGHTVLTGGKDWFSGEKIGIADFQMIFPMDIALQRGFMDPKKYPKLAAWAERIHARSSYKKAVEKSVGWDLKMFELKG